MYPSIQHCMQEDGNIQINLLCEARGIFFLCRVFEYPHFHVLRICQYRQGSLSSVWITLHHVTILSNNRTKKFYTAYAKAYHWSWSWASSIHVPTNPPDIFLSCFQSFKCDWYYKGPLFYPNHIIGHFLLVCLLHRSSWLGGMPTLVLSKTLS